MDGCCPKCHTNAWVLNRDPRNRRQLIDVCLECGYREPSQVKPGRSGWRGDRPCYHLTSPPAGEPN